MQRIIKALITYIILFHGYLCLDGIQYYKSVCEGKNEKNCLNSEQYLELRSLKIGTDEKAKDPKSKHYLERIEDVTKYWDPRLKFGY